jgi:hypothetical protein
MREVQLAMLERAMKRTAPIINDLALKQVGLNGVELLIMAAYALRTYEHATKRKFPRQQTLTAISQMADMMQTRIEPVGTQ